jgi:hypothetical protein
VERGGVGLDGGDAGEVGGGVGKGGLPGQGLSKGKSVGTLYKDDGRSEMGEH